ncbi:MAG: hypothetical protein KR126chlam2_00985 [Chlamydiae bacterium]|nr:hypothetical protein [Chlamydiota bacterium]
MSMQVVSSGDTGQCVTFNKSFTSKTLCGEQLESKPSIFLPLNTTFSDVLKMI